MTLVFKKIAVALAKVVSDKKGEHVTLLHLGPKSPIADYVLMVTALSRPHLESLETAVLHAARDMDLHALHRSRPASDHWRVIDFGSLMIHIMAPEAREFYSLEKLYHDAPQIQWEKNGVVPAKTKKTKTKTKK